MLQTHCPREEPYDGGEDERRRGAIHHISMPSCTFRSSGENQDYGHDIQVIDKHKWEYTGISPLGTRQKAIIVDKVDITNSL